MNQGKNIEPYNLYILLKKHLKKCRNSYIKLNVLLTMKICIYHRAIVNKPVVIGGHYGCDRIVVLFTSTRFLAHLAKGNVSFCHHLPSVVC